MGNHKNQNGVSRYYGPLIAISIGLVRATVSIMEASRDVRESRRGISLFPRPGARFELVLVLVMFNGIMSVRAQSAAHAGDSQMRQVAPPPMSPNSRESSSQGEFADLKLSHPVRQLAHWAGLPPKTIFHLCWDFNFLLMLGLIFWKGGPLLAEALQARSRLIRRAIDDAQQLAADAANRLAQVEKRGAQLDSEIAAIRAHADVEMNCEEQVLNTRTTEDIRRIMEYSQSEIDRATQRALYALKAFAADLGIHIARQSIKVDETMDRELVKGFFEGLRDQELAQTTVQPQVQYDRALAART